MWVPRNHPYWVFYFITFIVIGSFFLLNLFVGVVISSFNKQKDDLGGFKHLTELQTEWIETQNKVLTSKPMPKARMPHNKLGRFCYLINESQYFDLLIYTCIILNTFLLTLKWGN